jgi:hypothetical protein
MARSILLPEGMLTEHWISLLDGIDTVWKDTIDDRVKAVRDVRHSYVVPKSTSGFVDSAALSTVDRETYIKKIRFLGLPINNLASISDNSLLRLSASIGSYWFNKGANNLDKYLSYVFNVNLTIVPLWTNDYVSFYPKTDVAVGQPVYLSGTWYPSNKVRLIIQESSLVEVGKSALIDVFNTLAPYTIVIESIRYT